MSIAQSSILDITDKISPLSHKERFSRLQLARSQNVGPRSFRHLLNRYGSAVQALEALPHLAARGGRSGYSLFPPEEIELELERAHKAGAHLILQGEPAYPVHVAAIEAAPPALWVVGDTDLLCKPAVAIVGARNASALGLRMARRLATDLGALSKVIVSGLARGIDSTAHTASLETGTIAVMAGGVDCVYPPENAKLAQSIADQGVLISECPMGMEPTSRHFPQRNRLISALADGVVLIEAALRSGSLITARYAMEQGREVMACPGAPDDPRVGGCNALIRDGAALIRNAEDVIEVLSAPRTLGLAEDGSVFETPPPEISAKSETHTDPALPDHIINLLGPHPIDADELARCADITPAQLSLVLLELDLAGRIELLTGGRVVLRNDDT